MKRNTEHPSVEKLSAHIDSDLEPGRSIEIAEHLEKCSDCRSKLEELQATRMALGDLPDAEPGRDLWPAIERAIESESSSGLMAYLGRIWKVPVAALAGAAATLLVVLFLGGPPREVTGPAGNGLKGALAAVHRAEAEYRKAITALQGALDESRPDWSPEVREVVARSLAEIDDSIARCKAALRKDPHSRAAQDAILLAYQQKVDFLTDLVVEAG